MTSEVLASTDLHSNTHQCLTSHSVMSPIPSCLYHAYKNIYLIRLLNIFIPIILHEKQLSYTRFEPQLLEALGWHQTMNKSVIIKKGFSQLFRKYFIKLSEKWNIFHSFCESLYKRTVLETKLRGIFLLFCCTPFTFSSLYYVWQSNN